MFDSIKTALTNNYKNNVSVKWFTHLSICDRNFVSKMPLVLSVSEICPRNRKPRLVRSIKICRTISPRYIPLHIFSYLWCKRIKTAVSVSCKDALLTRDTICFLFFPHLNIFFCLLFDSVLLWRCWKGESSTVAGVAILLFMWNSGVLAPS